MSACPSHGAASGYWYESGHACRQVARRSAHGAAMLTFISRVMRSGARRASSQPAQPPQSRSS